MKQIVQNLKTGKVEVVEVPTPAVRRNGVLVRNHYSVISLGTEGGTVRLAKMNLLKKARSRPEQARKVIQLAKTDGPLRAYQVAMQRLDTPVPLGYSCAGTVITVGAEVDDVKVGDRVACGGAGWANHAEVVSVPRNLVVKVSKTVDLHHAAFTTMGAIALNSTRAADVRLGENVVVIGLGLVGLLTVQVLHAAGCNVLGVDLDPGKVALAKELGAYRSLPRSAPNLAEHVAAFANGAGADAVIITAATSSNDPVELAGELARFRGRVVVVGRVGMDAPRETYLYKELQLHTSLAYGPGNRDPLYEEKGLDYPLPFVRWTENRNMAAFVRLLETKAVDVEPLITHEFDLAEVEQAYRLLDGSAEDEKKPIGIILRYEPIPSEPTQERIPLRSLDRPQRQGGAEKVGVGVIGAGSFAMDTMVPILAKVKTARLRAIASASGLSAQNLGRKYGFEYCTSDYRAILDDPEVHGVFILTRHNLHAPLTIEALEHGKHVFVEKPLALTMEELAAVREAWQKSDCYVMVGFNRRYAPMAIKLKEFFASRSQPVVMLYRVNASYKPPEHWLHDPEVGGGRILGEACHFIDFMYFLTDSRAVRVYTVSVRGGGGVVDDDNVLITLEFEDGSIGSVAYASNGDRAFGKERCEVFCENKVGVLDDFRSLRLMTGGKSDRERNWFTQDKGHFQEISHFFAGLRSGKGLSQGFHDALHVSVVALHAVESLRSAIPVEVNLEQQHLV